MMPGVRSALLAIALAWLVGLVTLTLYRVSVAEQMMQRDADVITGQVRTTEHGDLPMLFDQLGQHYRFQYAQLKELTDVLPQTLAAPTAEPHWLQPILSEGTGQRQLKLASTELQFGLSPNNYLKASKAGYRYALLSFSLMALLLALISWRRNHAIQAQLLSLCQSLQPTGALNKRLPPHSGPLTPLLKLADELHLSYQNQLKQMKSQNAQQQDQAKQDPVTRLPNRVAFNQRLTGEGLETQSEGFLMLVRAGALEEINQRSGKEAGDSYLKLLAVTLKSQIASLEDAGLYRYSGADFLIQAPSSDAEAIGARIKPMEHTLAELAKRLEVDSAGYLAVVPYQPHDRLSQLLMHLDTGIAMAASQGPNTGYLMTSSLLSVELDRDHWQQVIDEIIDSANIQVVSQCITAPRQGQELYRELLVRFRNSQGQPLATETVFAMAARCGRAIELDKLVFTILLNRLNSEADSHAHYGINLSPRAMLDPGFRQWVLDRLSQHHELAGRLILELTERSLEMAPAELEPWVERAGTLGVRIAIDRFGNGLTSFKALQQLRPSYVKLTHEYVKGIEDNGDNRFFIKMLLDLAARLEIQVVATHVEQVEERLTLEALRLDGLQGNLIAPPQPWSQPQSENRIQ